MSKFNFKKHRRPWTYLSKIDILGAFDFMTLTVTFDSLETRDFAQLAKLLGKHDFQKQLAEKRLDPEIYSAMHKIFPLATHEYTHFLDTTSTVWGLQHIKLLDSVFQLLNSQEEFDKSDFGRCKILYDASRSIALPKFFTEIHKEIACDKPWIFRVSRGKRYTPDGSISKQPIMFVNFFNSKDQKFVRSPISISSLLEASAMNQELMTKREQVNHLNPDTALVEAKAIERREITYLYNRDITEYSVCVHLVGSFQNCVDIIESFQLAGKIALLALNFTEEAMNQITYSQNMLKKLGFIPDSADALLFIEDAKMNDRGVLFYMIARLTPKGSTGSLSKSLSGITEALDIMGLNINHIWQLAENRVSCLASELIKSESLAISSYAASAPHNFSHRELNSPYKNDFSCFHLPPALMGDLETRSIYRNHINKLQDFDVSTASDQLIPVQNWTENFAEACM